MPNNSNLSTGNQKYTLIYSNIVESVSTASCAITNNEEEITLLAKPIEEPVSKRKQDRVLKYKYNGARVTKIKRINALRNALR